MSRLRYDNPFEAARVDGPGDFVPDWDVPSFARNATDAITKDVEAVRADPKPDPRRKIHLLRGAPGQGKTHLFSRLRHRLADRAQFVFVPAPSCPARAAEHVAWKVAETLFEPDTRGIPPVRMHLARLLAPSFAAYFDQLPAGLRARTADDRRSLAEDPLALLAVFEAVDDPALTLSLTDALRARMPGVPLGVVKALLLGLSLGAAKDAEAWLRGEAEQLSDDRRAGLGLGDRSPTPTDVVRGAAALCGLSRTPLVLFFDQLELLYRGDAGGFNGLTAQAMGWLGEVPNLVLALGCLAVTWQEISGAGGFGSFVDRTSVHALDSLSSDEAADLVVRRLRSWAEYDEARAPGWPFDLDSVKRFTTARPVAPRGYIETCSREFADWLANGRQGVITLGQGPAPVTPDELFVREWTSRLAATRAGLRAAADFQEEALWEGAEEVLRVARDGQSTPSGVTFRDFRARIMRRSPSDDRPSALLNLDAGGRRFSVVLAVTKRDGGVAFGHWVNALDEVLGGDVVGAVVVRPRSQLTAGKTTAGYRSYQGRVSAGLVRPFPLDENEDTLAQMECLRLLVRDARSGTLTLNGEIVSEAACRELITRTRVLSSLKLFAQLFENWVAAEAGAPAPPPPPITPGPTKQGRVTGLTQPATATATVPAPPLPPPPIPVPGEGWADRQLATVVEKLRNKGQAVRPLGVEVGPTFARLKVAPLDDADFGRIKKQADNLKLHLNLEHRPLIAAQAGHISIDVQRPDRQTLPLAPLLDGRPAELADRPAFPAGVDVSGRAHWFDLADPATCHLLVAGTTGSGKSEFLKAAIAGLAHQLGPDQLQFVLVDPKRVTFNPRGESPYLRGPIANDVGDTLPVIQECLAEMQRRYKALQHAGLEHVGQLSGAASVPRWVVVFDEFADLMADKQGKKELEGLLKRLGAMGRAAGIHLVLGTQRPEASVVTPLLRENLPARVGLQMASERSSKLILEEPDAAYLLGRGDLFWRRQGGLVRLQSPYVTKQGLEEALRCH